MTSLYFKILVLPAIALCYSDPHQTNSNIRCTRSPLSVMRTISNTETSLMYASELLHKEYHSNYICTTDFLSESIRFQDIVPNDTVRLMIICNSSISTRSHLQYGNLKHLTVLSDLGFFNCKFDENVSLTDWLEGIPISRLFVENSKKDADSFVETFADDLYDNPKLHTAILARNKLTHLPTSLLCKWTWLSRLRLQKNEISDLSFLYNKCPNSSQPPLQNLEEMSLSLNNVSVITKAFLTSFPNLRYLKLDSNKIYSFDMAQTLESANILKYSPIQLLDVSNNLLNELHPCTIFPHITDLLTFSNPFVCEPQSLKLRDCESLVTLSIMNVTARYCEKIWMEISLIPQLDNLVISDNNVKIFDFGRIPKSLSYLMLGNSHIQTVSDTQNMTSTSKLVFLDMNSNELSTLGNFSLPPTLTSLNLASNEIATIDQLVFAQCSELSSVILNDNKLTSIEGLFSNLPKLSHLFLNDNNILTFDYSMIPPNLFYLSLSSNWISELTNTDDRFHEISIRYLNVSGNHFITLNQNSFAPSIFSLDLSNCEVNSCHAGTFTNLNLKNYPVLNNFTAYSIQNLSLTNRNILSNKHAIKNNICNNVTYVCSCSCDEQNDKIPQQVCCNTYNSSGVSLRVLYSEYTLDIRDQLDCVVDISCLDLCHSVEFCNNSYQYQPMKKLHCSRTLDVMQAYQDPSWIERQKRFYEQRSLLLNNMTISVLKPRAFAEFQQLLILNLDNNFLSEIRSEEFDDLISLTKLYLNDNVISNISSHSFKDMNNLELLELQHNRLQHLRKETFAGLHKLRRLNLNENSISVIHNASFAYLKLLTDLHLSKNQIQQIGSQYFIGLTELNKLHLDGNFITVIENSAFSEMKELKKLHLENNLIKEVSAHTFDGLPHLQVLNIHDNHISRIDENSFAVTSELRQLLLHNNQLKKWSVSVPKNLSNLSLAENQFPCDCKSILLLIEELSQIPANVLTDADRNRCTNQDSGSQRIIRNMTGANCDDGPSTMLQNQFSLHISTATTIISLLMLCGVIALYSYRLEVKVLLYAKFHVRLWTNKRENDSGKLFDAFLSYNADDRDFIADQLLPTLEKKFRVCVHERDFLVGAFIADTITDVVEKSCRTLIILSPNFLQSEWCLYEFRSAHYQGLKDRCCRLIIILLSEIEKDQLNNEIRAYMRTNTYLRWGDPLFWQKLMYAMPDSKYRALNAWTEKLQNTRPQPRRLNPTYIPRVIFNKDLENDRLADINITETRDIQSSSEQNKSLGVTYHSRQFSQLVLQEGGCW